ncbi:MAG: 2-oxo-3-hexenedioate decarboxylase [Myxococcota bacterium]|nr:2-oxo-3-hexenedioate decarboxylase [Myxococcota bacterium]
MPIDAATIEALARTLFSAARDAKPIVKITDAHPEITWDDAYAIQDRLRALHEAEGRHLVGLKMGLTSRAKMEQMGVEDPICGFLTDDAVVGDGEAIDTEGLIHPKVEAEVAFVTKAALRGPGCHVGDVLRATDFVIPALEVIDSRYENFRFDLPSVIADNTSASRFVTGGRPVSPRDVDLKTIGVVVSRNGEVVETGAGAAVLGDPALSVATLANMLGKRGREIPAGTLILTGGITRAILVEPGDTIVADYQHLGQLSVSFT